ncbi:hypothetical protein NX059_006432 [Plenodomus lindquistii]|nr:hypothetical protein NX059_006432 [Plenodomus lindquistii]
MGTPKTSPQSLKRRLEDPGTPTFASGQTPGSKFKRQRTIPSNYDGSLYTPPVSPLTCPPPQRTMSLRLSIPHEEPTKAELRALKLRVGAAVRWQSKLQRPYPSRSEIREAYQYKLMRHYTAPQATPEPNFVKPHIDRSPRVDKLRICFPVLNTSFAGSPTNSNSKKADMPSSPTPAELQLRYNKDVTRSKEVRRSAWKNFSSREDGRKDRGREAMMLSGLPDEELRKESYRQPNKLPDWKKEFTSKFAKSEKESKNAGAGPAW